MTLSLRGRLETRLFLLLAIGLPWTVLLVAAQHPGDPGAWVTQSSALAVITLMGLLGVGWECVYHALQQLRWDRDWPSLFSLLALAVEIGPLWFAVGALPDAVDRGPATSFLGVVGSAWLVMWAFAQGPMRVILIRWRLTGGRILPSRRARALLPKEYAMTELASRPPLHRPGTGPPSGRHPGPGDGSALRRFVAAVNGRYRVAALSVFGVIVLAHWAEHVAQMVQIKGMHEHTKDARGVLGEPFPWLVTSEWLHYSYALVMLIGLALLRPGFSARARTWWTVALVIQFWHHLEHLLLITQRMSGHFLADREVPTSILQLYWPRVELHMFYNTIVTIPMVLAMVYAGRSTTSRAKGHHR